MTQNLIFGLVGQFSIHEFSVLFISILRSIYFILIKEAKMRLYNSVNDRNCIGIHIWPMPKAEDIKIFGLWTNTKAVAEC